MRKFPSYLNLSSKELQAKVEALFEILGNCRICPRNCEVNRFKNEKGYCQLGCLPAVSSYHPHFGEESVLVGPSTRFVLESRRASSGQGGSGAIFFTSCNLSCVYCQNFEISQQRIGKEISFERLAEMMIELQEMGCHNINLVTPTPQAAQIIKALATAIEKGLKIPLVYNTSAYDSVETLKLLDGIIDIYMPDTKYSDDSLALKYSNAPRYFSVMKKAIKEMHRQVGDLIVSKEGIAVRGLVVRHLVLPNNLAGSEKIFEFLAREISPDTFLNIMDQYYPCWKACDYPELSRRITANEFEEAVELAKQTGLKNLYRE